MTDYGPIVDTYRLLPMQHGMLMHSLSAPSSGFYVGQVTGTLGRHTNQPALEKAWRYVIQRHAVLRTSFAWNDLDEPLQRVHADVPFHIDVLDWQSLSAAELQTELEAFSERLQRAGFDLATPPLMHITLFHLPAGDYQFVWTHHHALFDGRARLIILKEVARLYEAFAKDESFELPAPPNFRNYIEWFYQQDRERAKEYWRNTLNGFSSPVPLAEPFTTHQPQSGARFGRHAIGFSPAAKSAVKNLVQIGKVTPNIVMQAAWAILLSRCSGETDIVFGETRACRRPDFHSAAALTGLLINTVPLRVQVDPAITFSDLVESLRSQHVALRSHELLPLSEIRACSGIAANAPLFETIVVIEEYAMDAILGRDRAALWQAGIRRSSPTHYPLSLVGFTRPDMSLEIAYDRCMFSDLFAERMARRFENLLEALDQNTDAKLQEFSLLTGEEESMLMQWSQSAKESCEHSIAELFERQAKNTPMATALVFRNQSMTYRELNQHANQLARYLRAKGVKPEGRVGLCVERSIELIVSMLAIMKAGGVCVPLNMEYPADRLTYMVNDADVQVLLGQRELSSLFSWFNGPMLCLDREWGQIETQSTDDPGLTNSPENLACLMYTSGSSGPPKGVCITQRSIVRLVKNNHYAVLDSRQVFLQLAPVSFDASLFEIWGSLLNGGRLVVMPPGTPSLEEIGEILRAHQITTLWLTSGLFHHMVEHQLHSLGEVSQLLAGGDVLSGAHVEKYLEEAGDGHCIINGYGPTENTTFTCAYRMEKGWKAAGSVPIGFPIANTQVYVLDENLQLAPIEGVGSLYIGGAGLARGYTDAGLTAERFIPDSVSGHSGARLYQTGDRVRWRENGVLEFLGRQDHQVKIRGHRIESGDIEAALHRCEGIREAAVLVKLQNGEKLLAAFVSGEPRHTQPAALRSALQQQLPEYMIPAVFVPVERLPLTANGKVDRRALAALETTSAVREGDTIAPRSVTEELLAGIWADVLKLPGLDTRSNVFELGGNSLLAMQVRSRIRSTFRIDIAFRQLLELPTVQSLAASLDRELKAGNRCQAAPIQPVPREKPLPLSFAQQRLWFVHEFAPESVHYNIPIVLHLSGRLHVSALQMAMEEIVRRHEILRTTFQTVDGEAAQIIHPPRPWSVTTIDLRHVAEPERQSELERRIIELARTPFDLRSDMPLRASLFCYGPELHALAVIMHHIAGDGWSTGIFLRELTALYESFSAGHPSTLGELPVQYGDYALWERQWLQPENLTAQLDYWKRQLAGAATVLELPAFQVRPAMQTWSGKKLFFSMGEELLQALRTLCREQRATLHMALSAAFAVLLYRYTGQDDILIGTPTANRNRPEIESLIGFFVNTLVLRCDLSETPDFCQVLQRMRETALDAHAHQDLPFEQLVMELHPNRDSSREPLFQVMVVLQDPLPGEWKLGDVDARLQPVDNGTAKFDLTLSFTEDRDGLQAALEYNTDLFEPEMMQKFAEHYRSLVRAVVADPRQGIEDVSLLSEAERRQILEWSALEAEFSETKCLHHLFEEQAQHLPEAVAVVCGERRMTYAELNRRSNQLAHYLKNLGAGPETRIGICVERDVEMLAGIMGILKAGAAYVPLDPGLPSERLAFMAEDSGILICLTQNVVLSRLPKMQAQIVLIDKQWNEIALQSEESLHSRCAPENAAYVIYTSGSTGRPKGVVISHHNVVRLLQATQEWYRFTPADVWTLFHSYTFDFSVWEIWGALAYGGKLAVVPYHVSRSPEEFYQLVKMEAVTVLNQTPSAFQQFMQQDQENAESLHLRCVIFGGEALVLRHLAPWFARHQDQKPVLINMYGITETTVHVTAHQIRAENCLQDASLIGRPIADLQVYVLDRAMRLCPVGVAGEMYVGGAGLARGYLMRPELTAERFVPHPFSRAGGARLYRTGDRARLTAAGTLEFLGRTDRQVKVRGYRIELREIESVLESCPGVKQALVLVQESEAQDKRLLGCIVSALRPEELDVSGLKVHVQKYLPDYMTPTAFVVLEAFPLTANGKVDQRALLDLKPAEAQHDDLPPRTLTQQLVAGIWSEILNVQGLGISANFFDLGGHSLLAIKVASRIRAAFQIQISLRSLFEHPQLSEVAAHIDSLRAQQCQDEAGPIVRISRTGELPLSFNQEGRLLREWAERMRALSSQPFHVIFGLRLHGELDETALREAMHQIVRRHEVLRTGFQSRPVRDFSDLLSLIRPRQRGATASAVGHDSSRIASKYFELVVQAEVSAPIRSEDISFLSAARQQAELLKMVELESTQPFHYDKPPLFRAALLKTGSQEHLLIVTIHHMIADRWSVDVFQRDLASFYVLCANGAAPSSGELPVQYADFAAWQRQLLQGERLASLAAYWKQQWVEFPLLDVRELPFTLTAPGQSRTTGTEELALDTVLCEKLKTFARERNLTLYILFLAALNILLYLYTGRRRFGIWGHFANRTRPETENLIGWFANNHLLSAEVEPHSEIDQFIQTIRNMVFEADAHQEIPFPLLWMTSLYDLSTSTPEHQAQMSPHIAFDFKAELFRISPAQQLAMEPISLPGQGLQLALYLYAWDRPGQITVTGHYAKSYFSSLAMRGFLRDWQNVLENIIAIPASSVSAIALAGAAALKKEPQSSRPGVRPASV